MMQVENVYGRTVRYNEEAARLASGESLQMSRGSCMRSHMKEREMSMDGGITLKSRRV